LKLELIITIKISVKEEKNFNYFLQKKRATIKKMIKKLSEQKKKKNI